MRGDGSGAAPWGCHLRARGREFEDERGRTWSSVRDAFWRGRLGFPDARSAEEQQELLLRVLTSIDAGWFSPAESNHDLFGGDMLFWRFYLCWLASVGLVVAGRTWNFDAGLSEEGRAVMLMLQVTRRPDWIALPMADVVEAVRASGRGQPEAAREEALAAFERQAARLPRVFARERVGRLHMITLTGTDEAARIPVRRVVWSAPFSDERVRDDLFGWLAERVHRWEDWGAMAAKKGEAALTRHLLTLLAAEPIGVRIRNVARERP